MKNTKTVRKHRAVSARERLLAGARVKAVDACITVVTDEERQCKSLRVRKMLNRIQLRLLRRRLVVAMPILNPKQRATAVQVLKHSAN